MKLIYPFSFGQNTQGGEPILVNRPVCGPQQIEFQGDVGGL